MEKCDVKTDLLLFKIFHIYKVIGNKSNKRFSKEGMNIQVEQIPVLMVLFYEGPHSQQDIADELERDKSSVLRTVASLVAAGFLKVQPDTVDKRKKLVNLTEAGQKLAKQLHEEIGLMDNMMFSNLSVAEKLILTELLDKCTEHINSMDLKFE
ncbi:MarR family transcriptional regulator [Mucilaginibacter daejeonensis]|uniref:MarR family winged helix-turn-helix transcriptional regulator n=1 Tax=Mucilaginibacter daejeonensis TaxID=398049 RepID=UPI001D1703E3|nr:MarR family transcriptional regulator [Mucilaginibacter daejeonensis]UEG52418.1 MarR family transcriptional regulator [Mucilaginibacter daejeonensis]